MTQEKQSQKKVDYTVMSTKKCTVCKMPLKQNVVNQNPHVKLCYVCFKISQGKLKSTEHRMINGVKVVVKQIDFKKLQLQNINAYRK